MKKVFTLTAIALLPFLVMGQDTNENYIKTTTYQVETTTGTVADDDRIDAITYYDGLGRPIQTISARAGGARENIVSYMEYDQLGMQPKQYLPWASNGQVMTGSLDYITPSTLLSNINSFYNTTKYGNTTNPYSHTIYEESPLLRVEEQGAPGADWAVNTSSDNDHTIKYNYLLNTGSSVRQFSVSFVGTIYNEPTLVYDGYYPANELTVTMTRDENWQTSHGNYGKTYEYTNKSGQVILKRVSVDDLMEGPQNPNDHDTYYVYDMFGNLTYVISPEGSEHILDGSSIDTDVLDDLCYQYKYDERNRLIRKKIPGKGWEYIYYDRFDRPVLTQDAVQRSKTPAEYTFTKYDALDRVVYTGLCTSTFTIGQIQDTFNTTFNFHEGRTATATSIGGVNVYYTNTVFPTANLEVLTINYYDDASNLDLTGLSLPSSVFGENPNNSDIKGLPIVSEVKVLETSDWIRSRTGYDDKARAIYTVSINEYLDTTDKVEIDLDFTGKTLETRSIHQRSGYPTITIEDYFSYDHMGRLKSHDQKIDDEPVQLIANNYYDELGQLIKKDVGGESVVDGYTGIEEADVSFDGTITRNTTGPGWTSGAYTKGEIIDEGGVSFTIPEDDKYVRVGLMKTSSGETGWDDYDFGFQIFAHSSYGTAKKDFKLVFNGTVVSTYTGEYDLDDTFSVERNAGNIIYKQNGSTVHTASYSGNDTFIGKVGIYSTDGSVEDLTLFGGNIDKKLQEIDYKYNIRGWLTDINDINALDGDQERYDLFNFRINYNTIEGNSAGTPLYNGNIAQTLWFTDNDDKNLRGYNFEYDNLNRIISAEGYKGTKLSTMSVSTIHDLTGITYDYNGNIKSLGRNGPNDAGTSSGVWDDLSYYYDGNSNQLIRVDDNATGSLTTKGFNDGYQTINPDFDYDDNGNMTKDLNKGIDIIEYNHLNLPTAVRFDPVVANPSINYIYDATGVKIAKSVVDEGSIITQYAGKFIYSNNGGSMALEFISQPEGYIIPVAGTAESTKGSSGGVTTYSAYEYVFQYKDHLGNVRLSYGDSNLDGAISQSEVIEESNYYPFGLKQKGYNNTVSSNGNAVAQKYKTYQGQEFTEALGYNMHEYKFRHYDPSIARFVTIDPLAPNYVHNSTYAFSENRVIDAREMEGLEKVLIFAGADINGNGDYGQIPNKLANTIVNEVDMKVGSVVLINSNYWNPTGVILAGLEEAKSADPNEPLIIYGYSKGGEHAINLSRALDDLGIEVDLLITIDAADGPFSGTVSRELFDNVIENLNFYQRHFGKIGSRGKKNRRSKNNSTTCITNCFEEDETHYTIDDNTFEEVLGRILQELNDYNERRDRREKRKEERKERREERKKEREEQN